MFGDLHHSPVVIDASAAERATDHPRAPGQLGWQGWFDGTAVPNPGRIGLGIVLSGPQGERHELSVATGKPGCNNEAEMQALIALLELAIKHGVRQIKLCGDSDFAIRAARSWQNAAEPITRVPRLEALLGRLNALLDRFESVAPTWIPRHRNGVADTLARQALGLPVKPAAAPRNKKRARR